MSYILKNKQLSFLIFLFLLLTLQGMRNVILKFSSSGRENEKKTRFFKIWVCGKMKRGKRLSQQKPEVGELSFISPLNW